MNQQYVVRPKYRADIDGLRAIAILSVVAFHAFPRWIKGGFIGVDVFFVISGFLISSIIFGNLEKSGFSYLTFYARRIRRLFPALILVLITCLALGWFLLLPDEYSELGKNVAAGAGFVSNLMTWSEAGYFDRASDTKPLLHLWSLGIEEQFYIFWPLLLGLVWKYKLNFLKITIVIGVVSFLVNILTSISSQTADFYSPLSRFWELMIGGILAYITLHKPKHLPKNTNWSSLIGLILILIAVLTLSHNVKYPGWFALLPTVGTFLIISAQPTSWINRYVLGNRVMVGIGLISYPLYLWHWPLLVFARIDNYSVPSPLICGVIVVVSFVLATATYLFIERPIQSSHKPKMAVPLLASVMIFATTAGFVVVGTDGALFRFSDALKPYLTFPMRYDFRSDARAGICWLNHHTPALEYSNGCVDTPSSDKRLVLIWGDSHAARFYAGLRNADGGRDRLAEFARDVCPPILNFGYGNCIKSNSYVFGKIKDSRPDIVILFGIWQRYIYINKDTINFKKLAVTIRRLKKIGIKHIIIIGPEPEWSNSLPSDLSRQALKSGTTMIPSRSSQLLVPKAREMDLMLKKIVSARNDVTYFSAYDALCDDSGCLTTVDGTADGLTSWDYGHLTTVGATYIAKKFIMTSPYSNLNYVPDNTDSKSPR